MLTNEEQNAIERLRETPDGKIFIEWIKKIISENMQCILKHTSANANELLILLERTRGYNIILNNLQTDFKNYNKGDANE